DVAHPWRMRGAPDEAAELHVELSQRLILLALGLGLALVGLGMAGLLWRRVVGPTAAGSPLRVARNSLLPLPSHLLAGPLAPALAVTPAIGMALALFVLGLLPGQVSGSASALLSAFERMEVPAAAAILTNVLRVLLSVLVVANGGGIVALAVVSLVVNL